MVIWKPLPSVEEQLLFVYEEHLYKGLQVTGSSRVSFWQRELPDGNAPVNIKKKVTFKLYKNTSNTACHPAHVLYRAYGTSIAHDTRCTVTTRECTHAFKTYKLYVQETHHKHSCNQCDAAITSSSAAAVGPLRPTAMQATSCMMVAWLG